jgi:hypothetical protein
MHQPDPSNSPTRPVLKLKSSARRLPPEAEPSYPRPKSKLSQKPDAAWSDEFKRRMQEDMDALITR